MSDAAIAFLVVFVLTASGTLIGLWLARRRGTANPSEWDSRQRRLVVVLTLVYAATLGAIVAAFVSDHPWLGITIMVVLFVLPTFLVTSLRSRRS